MKAAVFYGIGDVRLQEVPIPDVGPGEVLVRIRAALTCGTDRKMYLRGYHLVKAPFILGHEFAGEVVEVGEGVDGFEVGMRVVAANSAPCNQCFFCKIGRESLCDNLTFKHEGGFAEYTKVPAPIVRQNLLAVPDGVSFQEAALTEPLSCVVHGVEESGIRLGDTVVINGAGPIGLMYTCLARLKGARVIVTDLSEERLQIARRLGADEVVHASNGSTVETVRGLTRSARGVDVAVEAVGLPEVWEKTVAMTRKGGIVILFGGPPAGTSITIDTRLLHYSELTLRGIFHHTPRYVRRALDLISYGKIPTDELITHEMPLANFSRVLEMLVNHQGVKIAVTP